MFHEDPITRNYEHAPDILKTSQKQEDVDRTDNRFSIALVPSPPQPLPTKPELQNTESRMAGQEHPVEKQRPDEIIKIENLDRTCIHNTRNGNKYSGITIKINIAYLPKFPNSFFVSKRKLIQRPKQTAK